MPFYEYQCNSCGHALGGHAESHDAPLKKCPHCGKSQLKRLMSAPVFRLKGGGWYETDFKSDQDGKRNLADRPETPAQGRGPKEEKKATTEANRRTPRRPMPPRPRKKSADKPAEKAAAQGRSGREPAARRPRLRVVVTRRRPISPNRRRRPSDRPGWGPSEPPPKPARRR